MSATAHDLVVIGGGPAGATAAARAARAGLDVLVLEAGAHPRAHVGESLLPGIIPILADIGALAEVQAAGFGRKTGSTLWNWGRTPKWDLWFADSDAYDAAWLVERARFDAILLDAARRAGALVHEHARVGELVWDGTRLVGVRWQGRSDADARLATARFVIDASGQSAMVARALELREPINGLRHQAMWAHFEHAQHLPPPRHEQALFVAEPSQWWWAFPLGGGRTSIGVVQLDAEDRRSPPRPDFDGELARSELAQVLGRDARRVTDIRHERDWSYRMREVVGPGWLAVGDAAGFIDPVLSTGVMLALHSGWHAAGCIASVVAGGADESDALASYREHHRTMFGDLLRMVRFYYQQNLHRDDYFWESKRILMTRETELRPQKAFVVLTSGLVQNLALERTRRDAEAHRDKIVAGAGRELEDDPARLGFVCVHLRLRDDDERAPGHANARSLYLLIEPAEPPAPALFRTRNFHVNAITPRLGNDPISNPALAPTLRELGEAIVAADTVAGEDLAGFWRRCRGELARRLRALPPELELVRVFGE